MRKKGEKTPKNQTEYFLALCNVKNNPKLLYNTD